MNGSDDRADAEGVARPPEPGDPIDRNDSNISQSETIRASASEAPPDADAAPDEGTEPGETAPPPEQRGAPSDQDARDSSEAASGQKQDTGNSEGRSKRRKRSSRPGTSIPWDEPLALVRYGRMSRVGAFRHNLDPLPRRDTQVVIRTDRGVELGALIGVTTGNGDAADADAADADNPGPGRHECGGSCLLNCARLAALSDNGGSDLSFSRQHKILRLASPQDLNDQVHLDGNEREKRQFCEQQAAELGLKMRLVAIEHLLGGERVVFYFTSESRVDFRELVRQLAAQYRTRIEMRQIGARDEARLVADYERCGRQCCCQAFLGSMQPVSIRMAKVQKATLDPSKISGRCNRLMCCLRFEDETYEHLRKALPKKNIWVRTEETIGKVISSQILTQLVKIVDAQGAVSVVENAAILERDVDPPAPGQAPPRPARPKPAQPAAREPAPPDVEQKDAPLPPSDGDKPKRRRRRRRKKTDGGAGGQVPNATGRADTGGQPRKKKRRRRRRPKDGGGGGGESGGA